MPRPPRSRPPRPRSLPIRAMVATLLLMATLAAASGCGTGDANAPQGEEVTLLLDFTPNAIHAGIYSAQARGFDTGEGITLHVAVPASGTDAGKLLRTGRVGFALMDIHDLALARARGENIQAIMAVIQRPLASVISAPGISSPRQLMGRLVGVSGLPSDLAVLHSVVRGSGGDPGKVRTVVIGFQAVPALLTHRVAGATAFWNDEGLVLRQRRPGYHIFRVDEFGAPSYPEIVLCASAETLRNRPQLARAMVRTLVRGYGVTLTDPEGSLADLESRVPGLDHHLVAAELAGEQSAFLGRRGAFGELSLPTLKTWAGWEARFGIVQRPPDVRAAFDPRFLAGTASLIGS